MKRGKRIISLLLTLCLVAGLCLPAAAVDTELLAAAPQATITHDDERAVYENGAYTSGGAIEWDEWDKSSPPTVQHHVTVSKTDSVDTYPTVTLTFTGGKVVVYGQAAVNGPVMTATIDGEEAGEADFYGTSNAYENVYESPELEGGEHTLVLTLTQRGELNGKASLQAAINRFEVFGPAEPHAVTVEGGSADKEEAKRGETVTVTAEDKTGYIFSSWTAEPQVAFEDAAEATTTFVMPDEAVTVTARYTKDYSAGTTFYVDAEEGNDANEGTSPGAAWKTLEQVNAVSLKPGDRILLKAGSVFEGQSLALRGSGSADEPIVVDMYDGDTVGAEAGEKPHIKADGVAKAPFVMGNAGNTGTTSYPAIAYGVHIKNVSHIQVNNLEITNTSGSRQLAVGVAVEAESGQGVVEDIHLDGLYVHDVFGDLNEKTAPNGGIYFITTAAKDNVTHPTRFDNISVENCTVSNVSRTGISVGPTHSAYSWEQFSNGIISDEVKTNFGHTQVVIRNNYVENAGGDSIVPQYCISPLVEYNISNGASQNTKGNQWAMYNAAIWPWRCEDAVFQYNEAYGTILNGDGQAYDCDFSRGTVYQYNYSHDNEGGFLLVCQRQSIQSTIRYNISQNDRDYLFLMSNTEAADIYNNTFYIGEGLNTNIVELNGPANLKNNIFYNLGTRKSPRWGSFTYDNNLYYGFDSVPADANKIEADPLFTDPGKGGAGTEGNSAIDTLDGYALLGSSPAIGAGLIIANNGGRDYAGNPVSATEKPNLGAMEAVSTDLYLRSDRYVIDEHAKTVTVANGTNISTLLAALSCNQDASLRAEKNGTAVTEGLVDGDISIVVSRGSEEKTYTVVLVAGKPVETITVKTADGTVVNQDTRLKVYTNKDHAQHSLTLTAEVEPEDATNKNVNWTRTEVTGKVTLARNGNQLTVTADQGEAETNVGEVELNVYAEADPNVKQTIKVQVIRMLENPVSISIHGVDDPDAAPKFGQTLEADINQLKMTDAGKAALSYQWKRNGSAISGATAKTYTLTAADIGATISVDVAADPNTYYEGTRSATRSQAVVKAEGPAITADIYGVKGADNSNGKIVGFPTSDGNTYEYKLTDAADTAESWTTVSTDEVTVAAGSYVVRIKATTTHEAGPTRNVTVPTYDSDMHRVILGTFQNGTITRDHPQADPDTTITLTVKPATGYELDTITVTGASGSVTVSGTGNTRTFKMPDEDVTVSATFKKIKLTIDHSGLVNLRCSKDVEGVLDDHEVEYGDIAAITLVPDSGYGLPAGEFIEITNADGVKITGWTISRDGTITITGGVTSNLTIKAAGVVKTYVVNYTLTNGLSAPETGAPRQVAHKAAYTGTLVAASGYTLPESITITMGGEEFTEFTYENGTLTIAEGKITGNLVITASGTADGGSGDSGNSSGGTTTPPTSTEVKENPDGSTTTTVTDKKTGTVTETTEKPDGTKEIVETKKDGTVTETTEKPDGSKEIVETKPDGTVTETKTGTEGGEVAKVTDPDQNVEIKVTDPSGEVLAEVKLPAEIPVPENRFVDVPESHWADEAVHEMAGLGLVSGVGNNKFDMSSSMKRGDLALILSRLSNAKADYELTFTDVPAGKYYANGVAWAAKSGVVTGRSAEKFDPEATITRGELAVMLYRYAMLLKMDTTASAGALDAFKDGSATPDWAMDGLAWCVENGILKGKGGGILDSTATTTRAEVAVMLQRFVNLMK